MKKILLIEDNLPVSEEVKLMLQFENYEVVEAKNGLLGFEMAKQLKPDLIICDINIPEFNGFETLTKVRDHITTINIPFIFQTSNADKDSIKLARDLGADDYVIKPYDPEKLLDIVKTQLEKRTSAIILM
jgi:two-component system sensor histidine kinase/response regulator